MLLSVRIIKAIILVLTMISGLSMNSSIVVEFCRTWSQKHQPAGHILLSTAVTHLLLQCSITLDGFLYLFFSYVRFVQEVYILDLTILYFLIEVCFWHATWLSIYYCLKLVNLPNQFFLQLKRWFSPCVPLLLTGSTIGSFIINLPLLWTLQITFHPNMTGHMLDIDYPHIILNLLFGCFFPFLITFSSIVLSIKSLLSHIMKMKNKENNFRRPPLKAHVGAVKTMVSRLVLDLILCLVAMGLLISKLRVDVVVDTFCWLFLMLYSTFQSIIFILGNPKLKTKLFPCI
ncbi:taste receptor type 2 member 4-like [Anomaloglossus baeobatrachus]|uniref:taste receptor type 2 member 4-like n=1 Tax=Anomaloglossus baeobatrachus TaxID=238106 RepID=UPI003F4F65E4